MVLGIVGSEGAKFTPETEAKARGIIRSLFLRWSPEQVVSGACHLGGIDVWAIEEATAAGIPTQQFPPRVRNWAQGFKPRNIQIARASDAVVCITLRELPPTYKGMRFAGCYHCARTLTPRFLVPHVKSSGCWTVHFARSLEKYGDLKVID